MEEKKKYKFVPYLRVVAMFMVAYTHLGPLQNPDWTFPKMVQSMINTPFAIIQNFGALGVSFFFIISGFFLYKNKDRTTHFIKKKLLNIYIPLWVWTGIFIFVIFILSTFGYQTYWAQFTLSDFIKSCTLYDYLIGLPDVVNGPLWYLFPLTIAYFLYLPFTLKGNRIGYAMVVNAWMLFATFSNHVPLGIRNLSPYLGILLSGYILALFFDSIEHGEKRGKIVTILFIVNMVITVLAFKRIYFETYYSNEPYLVSSAYACLIFAVCYLLEDHFTDNKVINFLSNNSYPFYVVHSLYGGLVSTFLVNTFNPPKLFVFLSAIGTSLIAANISQFIFIKTKKLFEQRM